MKFIKKLRNIAVGSDPGPRYVLQIEKGEMVSFNKLCDLVAQMSTVHRSDAKAVFDVMGSAIVFFMREGHSVKIDGFGIFYPRLSAYSEKEHEELTAQSIKRITVGFRPDVELRDQIKNVSINIQPYKSCEDDEEEG